MVCGSTSAGSGCKLLRAGTAAGPCGLALLMCYSSVVSTGGGCNPCWMEFCNCRVLACRFCDVRRACQLQKVVLDIIRIQCFRIIETCNF